MCCSKMLTLVFVDEGVVDAELVSDDGNSQPLDVVVGEEDELQDSPPSASSGLISAKSREQQQVPCRMSAVLLDSEDAQIPQTMCLRILIAMLHV